MYVKLTYIHVAPRVNVHGSQYCLSKYCSFCLVQEVMSLFSSIYAKPCLQILKQELC